ncbi:hypothetical protein Nmel_000446, partial [Mimus melanotis]
RCNEFLKTSYVLTEACPWTNAVFGKPDFSKVVLVLNGKKIHELTASLEMMYGQDSEADDSGEHDEAQKGVIMSTYNKAIYKVNHEQSIISVTQNRYLASVEAEELLNRRHVICCLSVKKIKPLLLNLFCCNRLMPEQVLRNDCFLIADMIPVSLQIGKEYELHKKQK